MIQGFSKFINQYLAPLLSLTSLVLIVLSFLSPSVIFSTRVALLTVSPSSALTQPGSQNGVDGPSVFLGALGSCERPNNGAAVECTPASISPKYDLHVLPGNAPDLLSAPAATTPAFIAVSITFTILFFFLYAFTALRTKMGKAGAFFDKPLVQRATAWIGLLGFMIGLTSFLVIRMWFGKAVEDFNNSIIRDGGNGPQLVAATSNGFVMIYVAYAFYAVPLVCSLAKFQVTATKA